MANLNFDKETALLVIDPYNDFLPSGRLRDLEVHRADSDGSLVAKNI